MQVINSNPLQYRFLFVILGFVILVIGLGWAILSGSWRYISLNLGSLYLAQASTSPSPPEAAKQAEQAEAFLTDFVQKFPTHHHAWRLLGFALILQGDEASAIEAWQKAENISDEFVDRAQTAYRMADYQQAAIWYERALKLGRENYAARIDLAKAYIALQEYPKALQALGENTLLYPEKVETYSLLCNTYRSINQPEQALPLFENAPSLAQNDPQMRLCIGKVYWDLQQYPEAAHHLELAAAGIPNDAATHNWLSLVYNRQGRTDEAVAESELAVELAANSIGYLTHLTNLYISTKQFEKAQLAVEKFLAIDPNNAQAKELLSTIQKNLSQQ